jgi:hypothetical protein
MVLGDAIRVIGGVSVAALPQGPTDRPWQHGVSLVPRAVGSGKPCPVVALEGDNVKTFVFSPFCMIIKHGQHSILDG